MIKVNTDNAVVNGNFNILEPLDAVSEIYKKNLNTEAYCILLYGKEYKKWIHSKEGITLI